MTGAEGLPAIVFHVRNSSTKGAQGNKYTGRVELDATFTDHTMWDDVLEQLEGFALNRGDFKSEIIDVLREKNREMEGTVQSTAASANTEVQHMRQELSLAKERIRTLELMVGELEALESFTVDE